MKRMICIALIMVLILVMTACGKQNADNSISNDAEQETQTISESTNKQELNGNGDSNQSTNILVAYFSRTGTTKPLAEYAAEYLGADIFEIEAAVPYTDEDIAYYTDCRADREQDDKSARPEIAGKVENMEQYDTIIIGYPIWHGQAVRETMDEYGIAREDIFVITKLYPGEQYNSPEEAIEEALEKLDIGYIDMMLLHHPGNNDVKAYLAMEKYVEEGKIRSLGLSNWYIEELDSFLPQVNIKPSLVQNEIHPYYQESEVIDYIHSLDIVVQGWYPLGGRGYTAELLSDDTITKIVSAHGVSSAQVILRWDLQNGVVVIPGSSNPDHILENTMLYDFELTDEEMAEIKALNRDEKHDWY